MKKKKNTMTLEFVVSVSCVMLCHSDLAIAVNPASRFTSGGAEQEQEKESGSKTWVGDRAFFPHPPSETNLYILCGNYQSQSRDLQQSASLGSYLVK